MITFQILQELALSFPEATEEPHFEKSSFRIKKKIFASYDASKNIACLKLTEMEQSVFAYDPEVIYPVPNKWGRQGWTYIELNKVKKNVLRDALKAAYDNVGNKKQI